MLDHGGTKPCAFFRTLKIIHNQWALSLIGTFHLSLFGSSVVPMAIVQHLCTELVKEQLAEIGKVHLMLLNTNTITTVAFA